MKIKKTNLPTELLFEVVRSVPFNIKWDKIRVSRNFDIFIYKFQKKWIVREKNPRLKITKAALILKFTNIAQKMTSLIGVENDLPEDQLQLLIKIMNGIFNDYRFFSDSNDEIDEAFYLLQGLSPPYPSVQIHFESHRTMIHRLMIITNSAIRRSRNTDFFDWTFLSEVVDLKVAKMVDLALPIVQTQFRYFFCVSSVLFGILFGYLAYKKHSEVKHFFNVGKMNLRDLLTLI